tara:strand:+ start:5190 stop:5435 length:246 start_codon:yes stop_codon:yes gene_type:complete
MKTHDKIIIGAASSLLERKEYAGLKREGKRTETLGRAYDASLALLEALDSEETTLSEVKDLVNEKKVAVLELKKVGIDWPL